MTPSHHRRIAREEVLARGDGGSSPGRRPGAGGGDRRRGAPRGRGGRARQPRRRGSGRSRSSPALYLRLKQEDETRATRDLDRAVGLAVVLAERVLGGRPRLGPDAGRQARGSRRSPKPAAREGPPSTPPPSTPTPCSHHLGRSASTRTPSKSAPTLPSQRGSLRISTNLGTLDAQLHPQLERLAASPPRHAPARAEQEHARPGRARWPAIRARDLARHVGLFLATGGEHVGHVRRRSTRGGRRPRVLAPRRRVSRRPSSSSSWPTSSATHSRPASTRSTRRSRSSSPSRSCPRSARWGAVIKMRGAIPSRRALLDIGASGPLAGLVFAIPLYAWGIRHSQVVPRPVCRRHVRRVAPDARARRRCSARTSPRGRSSWRRPSSSRRGQASS